MYPAQFTYHRAGSVAEAVQMLSGLPGPKLLAGGHSLLPLMKLRLARPESIVDIGRIDALRGISANGGTVTIGPLTTHASLAGSPQLASLCPLLAEAAAVIGDPAVRNRGTIGGNVVHADPGSDLPNVLTALGATLLMTGPGGERTVAASDFFTGFMESAILDGEVLTGISVPAAGVGTGMAYAKMFHPASRYALVSASVVLTTEGGACTRARVALGGLAPRPVNAASVEGALVGKDLTVETIRTAAAAVSADLGDDLLSDIHASGDYRRAMASVYVERALTSAAGRAAGS